MKFTLEINMDNAAFDEDFGTPEVARILTETAVYLTKFELISWPFTVRDSNGNTVGTATITED